MEKKIVTKVQLSNHGCKYVDQEDELAYIYPGKGRQERIKRWLGYRCLASLHNYRSFKYIRSKAGICHERRRQVILNRWMIHPFSQFRVAFEILMICIHIGTLIYVPVVSSYNLAAFRNKIYFIITLCLDICCWLGIVVNFFTGYVEECTRQIYLNPRFVARQYIRSYFFLDVLTAIPTYMAAYNSNENMIIIDIISLVRLLRVFPLLRFYKNTTEVFDFTYCQSSMTKLIITAGVFLHSMACLHFLTARIFQAETCEYVHEDSWIKEIVCTKYSSFLIDAYFKGLFRSFSNTFLAGFGQQKLPSTSEDMCTYVFGTAMGRILIYVMAGKIMHMTLSGESASVKYQKVTIQLREYMWHKKLRPDTQKRIMHYYDFRFQQSFHNLEKIMDSVNTALRQDIVLHSCRRLVENVAFFNNIPMSLLVRISSKLINEIYLPNDIIIKVGEKGDSMYFIKTGTVAIYSVNSKEVCHLEDGAHFGEVALVIPEEKRVATVIAVETCEVYRLDRRDFELAIAPFPDLLQRIQRLAEKRMERTREMDLALGIAQRETSFMQYSRLY